LKKIIISVTNDLVSDQRVHRTATTLSEFGLEILLVGRCMPTSMTLTTRVYSTHRIKVPFRNGFMFYLTFNIWLFFFLLFHKCDTLISNDLDTLPANFLVSKIKGLPLVFDSHELFTELPELTNRPFIKRIWTILEKIFLPRIKYGITVCNSISKVYKDKYNIDFTVIRNLPFKSKKEIVEVKPLENNKRIIIYQGALNIGRGLELVIDSMKYLDNYLFLIAGDGDISEKLHERAKQPGLEGKIKFPGRIPLDELQKYTQQADLGISLEENLGLNYYYALPNKLFDYIQANVPVLTSDFPEMSAVVKKYDIGIVTNEKNAEKLAILINQSINNKTLVNTWKENLKIAREELCWEKEKIKLIYIFRRIGLI
jgi:glycosyltransferase involved in cell wall biosynthesis